MQTNESESIDDKIDQTIDPEYKRKTKRNLVILMIYSLFLTIGFKLTLSYMMDKKINQDSNQEKSIELAQLPPAYYKIPKQELEEKNILQQDLENRTMVVMSNSLIKDFMKSRRQRITYFTKYLSRLEKNYRMQPTTSLPICLDIRPGEFRHKIHPYERVIVVGTDCIIDGIKKEYNDDLIALGIYNQILHYINLPQQEPSIQTLAAEYTTLLNDKKAINNNEYLGILQVWQTAVDIKQSKPQDL